MCELHYKKAIFLMSLLNGVLYVLACFACFIARVFDVLACSLNLVCLHA